MFSFATELDNHVRASVHRYSRSNRLFENLNVFINHGLYRITRPQAFGVLPQLVAQSLVCQDPRNGGRQLRIVRGIDEECRRLSVNRQDLAQDRQITDDRRDAGARRLDCRKAEGFGLRGEHEDIQAGEEARHLLRGNLADEMQPVGYFQFIRQKSQPLLVRALTGQRKMPGRLAGQETDRGIEPLVRMHPAAQPRRA